jgi:hypothetical protein
MTAGAVDLHDDRSAAEISADETRGALPDVIYLPDQSQPKPEPQRPKPGRHTGKMKGRHFGPRPVEDPLTARFNVRCRPEFLAKLSTAAEAAGLSLSAYVCKRLGGDPGPRSLRAKPGPDMVLLSRLLGQHGKAGSNLNQIARQLNSGGDVEPSELAEAIAEHRAACQVIISALGVPPDADNY